MTCTLRNIVSGRDRLSAHPHPRLHMKTLIDRLNRIEEYFIGYVLLLLAFVTTAQVLFRYAFGMSFDWVEEGSRYMTILITFVGAGICVRYGSHFAMDALVQYMPPRGRFLMQALAMFVSALVMAVICYFGWVQIFKLHKFGATTPVLHLPMYVPYLPIGIFAGVISCRFFLQGCLRLRELLAGKVVRAARGGE